MLDTTEVITRQDEFLATLFNTETVTNINLIINTLNKNDYGDWEDELNMYINIDELTIESGVLALKIINVFREPVNEYLLSKGIILEPNNDYSINFLAKLILVTTRINKLGIDDAIYIDGLINDDSSDDESDLILLFLKIANYTVDNFDLGLLYNSIRGISESFVNYTKSKILKVISENELSPSINDKDIDELSLKAIKELTAFILEHDIGNIDSIYKILLLGVANISIRAIKERKVILLKNIDFYLRELDEEDYIGYIKPKIFELSLLNLLLKTTPLAITISTLESLELDNTTQQVRIYITDLFKEYKTSESYTTILEIKKGLENG